MSETAKFTFGDQTIDLPVFQGTEAEKAVDISILRAKTGFITYDNGFGNTGACVSAITFLDGELGILKYRGFSIEELCEKSNFVEVSKLLIDGTLPNAETLSTFKKSIGQYSKVPEGIKALIKTFPRDAHPMAILSAAIVALSAYYPDVTDQDLNAAQKEKVLPLLMGQLSTIAAYIYRHGQNLNFVDPDPTFSYIENFLYMMNGKRPDAELVEALDILLILHADHEQNCSTSTVRVVGSSKANLFASVSAGIDALWGPLHGGANQAVLEMLEEIQKDGGGYQKFILKAKDKNDTFRLMGFGHRVYKNFDPRAKIIKKYCDVVLAKLGKADELLDIAKGLESVALSDNYFVERKLYPNVDFYSGIIYKALGIPTNMFTVMFALGRLPGWMAQWKEMIEDPNMRICRPRQIFTGETKPQYVAVEKR
jgi:citrate synthase